VIGFTLLTGLGPGVKRSEAQQIRVEGAFPRQLTRGQATLINVAVPSRDSIQAVEISEKERETLRSAARARQRFRNPVLQVSGADFTSISGQLSIDVADNAAPGNRTMVLVLPAGRTAPVTITIASHVPSISELRVLSGPSNPPANPPASPPALELQFAAVDGSADLGDSPYVWFMIGCAGDIHPGVVHGKVTLRDKNNGVVRASVPNLPIPARGGAAANEKCDLQVRVTDSGGIESNTLKTTIDFRN